MDVDPNALIRDVSRAKKILEMVSMQVVYGQDGGGPDFGIGSIKAVKRRWSRPIRVRHQIRQTLIMGLGIQPGVDTIYSRFILYGPWRSKELMWGILFLLYLFLSFQPSSYLPPPPSFFASLQTGAVFCSFLFRWDISCYIHLKVLWDLRVLEKDLCLELSLPLIMRMCIMSGGAFVADPFRMHSRRDQSH